MKKCGIGNNSDKKTRGNDSNYLQILTYYTFYKADYINKPKQKSAKTV